MAKQPRIIAGGLVGYATGMYWSKEIPLDSDIDADNDGVVEPVHEFQLDLSRIAARAIGYQASMMAGYKLHSVKVGIRPVDDNVDNDASTQFAGLIDMYPATEHAQKALSLARKVEKADEASQVDADSLFLRTSDRYTGFRYGWSASDDDGPYAKTGNSIAGMAEQWYLNEIFDAYEFMTDENKERALFGGRAPEQMSISWSAGWNTLASGYNQGINNFDSETKCNLMVLPLLRGQVKYSSSDETGAVDDDYRLWVEVEFTPEAGGAF